MSAQAADGGMGVSGLPLCVKKVIAGVGAGTGLVQGYVAGARSYRGKSGERVVLTKC